jgi:peptide deformylase
MAKRNIVLDGDPILKKKCRPVTEFNEKLGLILDDMKETMIDANGVGLAAPQVGFLRRYFIAMDYYIDEDGNEVNEIYEFINPEILQTSGENLNFEGCLSFPGKNGLVKRPKYVKVNAQDRNGKWFEMEAEGLLARIICHENDHLNGITIMDNATRFYEDMTEEERERLKLDEY